MSQSVGSGSQYNPNVDASLFKESKPELGQKPAQASLEYRTSLVAQRDIPRNQKPANIPEIPLKIANLMTENQKATYKNMGTDHKRLCLSLDEHMLGAYLNFKASPSGLAAAPQKILAEILIDMASKSPDPDDKMFEFLSEMELSRENRTKIAVELAEKHPFSVICVLYEIDFSLEEKVRILYELVQANSGLVLDYLNDPELEDKEKTLLLYELANVCPGLILENIDNIGLVDIEKSKLLEEAQASQGIKIAFGEVFTEDRQQAAENHNIPRSTINKAMLVALRALQRGQFQSDIYNPQDEFIASFREGDSSPEITFKANYLGEGALGIAYKVFMMSTGDIAVIKEAKMESGVYDLIAEQAIMDLRNEVKLLNSLEGAEGLQKPPHRVVYVSSQKGALKVGYIGRLYSGDMKEVRPEKPEQRVDVVRQLLLGLKTLHNKGIRHGDIKPRNIFIDNPQRAGKDKYQAYIADLGGARSFESLKLIFEDFSSNPTLKSSSDVTIRLLGSFTLSFTALLDKHSIEKAIEEGNFNDYKSIEQARDVYALGLSVLLMFVCGNAEEHNDVLSILGPVNSNNPELKPFIINFLSKGGLTPGQIEILTKMISADWKDRPSVDEVLQLFQ